ncbi:FecR family protein [Pedobacter sp. WC2501]|uniref:FecR family protein n=1 Tax=Pedobacter sp. WC2501 TaxID=3461400 RepID=UPI004045DE96
MKNDQLKEILDRYLAGKCSPEEALLIEKWYDQLSESDKTFYAGDNEKLIESKNRTFTSLNEKLLIVQETVKARSLNLGQLWFRGLAAACLILMISSGVWFYMSFPKSPTYTTIVAGIGQIKVIELPDSTKIWLNAGSTLRYANTYGEKDRDVFLNGEGYFDVQHNTKLPFNVYSGKLKTHVLGTAFSISCYPSASTATITVTRGKVQVGQASKLLGYLTPDQQLELDKSTDRSRIIQVDAKGVANWREGKLAFVNMPMQDIVAHLEKWYGVNFEFKDKRVQTRRFTASFSDHTTLKNLLEVIRSMNHVEYKFDEKAKTVIYY